MQLERLFLRKGLIIFVLMAVFLLQPFFSLGNFHKTNLVFTEGTAALGSPLGQKQLLEIRGEVLFYPERLYFSLEEFHERAALVSKDRELARLPGAWKAEEGPHYGTYYLILEGLELGRQYGFFLWDAYTSFYFFADGRLIFQNGAPAVNSRSAKPERMPGTAYFEATGERVEILIPLSNFENHMTGLWQSMIFGNQEDIRAYEKHLLEKDLLLTGALTMVALYHGLLYLFMRKDKASLYFAGGAFFILIKTIFSGMQLGFTWYPFFSYEVATRVAHLSIVGLVISLLAFVTVIFPREVHPGIVSAVCWISGIQSAVLLLFPLDIFQRTFIFYQFFAIAITLMILWWSLKALQRKRQGAILYLAGFGFLLLVGINDVLFSLMIVETGYYLGAGLLILIFSQSAIIAQRFQRALETEERMKENLEKVVTERTEQLHRERNMFEHLSKVDSLTRIYNKGYMKEALNIEFEAFRRYGGTFCVILLDLDHFKIINDNYGHLAGDEVLIQVAELLRRETRKTDVVGRFGGEEFMIIMRFTRCENALRHAETLRKKLEEKEFATQAGVIKVTASFGISEIEQDDRNDEEVVKRADMAMYKAKEKGRNKVIGC